MLWEVREMEMCSQRLHCAMNHAGLIVVAEEEVGAGVGACCPHQCYFRTRSWCTEFRLWTCVHGDPISRLLFSPQHVDALVNVSRLEAGVTAVSKFSWV